MNILITGGTGFLGRHLAAALLERSEKIFLLGRNFAPVQDLVARGAVPVEVDLRDGVAVKAACRGMELVYHVGALSAPWGRRADFFATNLGGTEALLAGCQEWGVRRLVYISSPSVVFDGGDQFMASEQVVYPHRFASVYSQTKKLGEDRVLAAAAAGLETVTLRPKAIFGPGDQALLPRLIAAARRQRLPQIGDGRNLVDLTYVENVVHALLLAAEAREAVGKIYTITNGEHPPLWEVIREVLRRLGLPDRLRAVPLPLALAVASLMEARAVVTGSEPLLTRYSVQILARTQTYDISAAQRELGYTPRISLADGINRTLAALKEEAKT
ncbi:MAG TPA: NAD-dependent epimerase/dehydratase family protein [Ktedonobacteraceae bacterium]